MAINIKFDLNGNPEMPTIILATRSGEKLGQLDARDIELSDKLVGACEITFTLNKYIDDKITNLWDKVTNFKLVYCKEWDMWFEIRVELDEETETVKTVFCTQLGQAELSQIMLYDIEINTEKDIERDDYKISILYDQDDPESSILIRLLDKVPHYSIVHVDSTIARIQRSFSFNDTSVYDAFQDIAKEIGCLFVFNSDSDENGNVQRTISVYDLQQNCLNPDCRYRGEYTDKCPKCGGTNIKYGYGDDTLIFVTADELAADNIQFVTDTDSVKNCFKLEAGDDLMTATVRNCNPNGTDYIWHFSDDTKQDMSDELVNKIESYDDMYKYYYNEHISHIDPILLAEYNALITKYSVYNRELKSLSTPIKGYSALMKAYYDVIDLALYLESGLMPEVTMSDTNAEKQANLLNAYNLSPVAVTNLETVSLATANSTILAMAKSLVKSTYKVSIKSSNLSGATWRGSFTVTNYSDDEDTADTGTVIITINDDYEEFVRQKLNKTLSKENTDNLSISDLFKIEDTSTFRNELKKYALNPLNSFLNACQACIDILIEQGAGSKSSELYSPLYTPYYNKLGAIEAEIRVRESEIGVIKGKYDLNGNLLVKGLGAHIEEIKSEIQEKLNFENYLGTDLWLEFSVYRREDKYTNVNYISDGLDNAQLFERALEFIEVAENEIFKSSELQHSISTSLNNLLAIEKFKPLTQYFKVGNWLRIQVDDQIYKLRLLEYEISYEDFGNIPVVFSDVTKVKNGMSDLEDVLSQASSMATSYDSLQKQASKANVAKGTIDEWLEYGLNSALIQIQNNNSEEITMNESGLLCRSYSDITEDYSPEQLKLTHNIMAYTDDNWESVRQAIGKHLYVTYDEATDTWIKDNLGYGMSADFVTAGQVMGSTLVGGEIYSANYHKGTVGSTTDKPVGTYIDLETGDFELGGKKLIYDSETNILTLDNVVIKWENSNPPATSDIEGLDDYLNQLDGRIQTYSQSEDPSLNWNNEEKAKHIGDLWIDSDDGITRRWTSYTNGSETVYKWEVVTDTELEELAKSKAQIFTVTPFPPYYVGDLWVEGSTGDIRHCITPKDKDGEFSMDDWAISSKYTDDSALESFIDNEYADDLLAINGQIDKKAETWYQSSDPSVEWTTEDLKKLHVGDLWFDTDENKSYIYTQTYDDSTETYKYEWLEADGVPDIVYDKIDGKSSIYTSKPSSQQVGDLLIPTETFTATSGRTTYTFTAGKIYTCTATMSTFDPYYWTEAAYTDDTTALAAKSIAEQAKTVGDKLVTDLGCTQVSGTYVISPYIGGGYLNIANDSNSSKVIIDPYNLTGNGYIFQVYANGETTVGIDSGGSATFKGTIYATDGEFTGDIIGGSININNRFMVDSSGNVTIPSGTISIGDLSDSDELMTESQVTTITKNTITTSYVNALNITAKDISATELSGKTIKGGSLEIGSGTKYTNISTSGYLDARVGEISIFKFDNDGFYVDFNNDNQWDYNFKKNSFCARIFNKWDTERAFVYMDTEDTTSDIDGRAIIFGNDYVDFRSTGRIRFQYGSNASDEVAYIDTYKDILYMDGSIEYRDNITKVSDKRLKNDLGDVSITETLNILNNLNIKKFTYKSDKNNRINYGIYAQDLRDILQDYDIGHVSALSIYDKNADAYIMDLNHLEDDVKYSVDYTQFIPLLIKAYQNLSDKVKKIEELIDE